MVIKSKLANKLDYFGLRIVLFFFGAYVLAQFGASLGPSLLISGAITIAFNLLIKTITKVQPVKEVSKAAHGNFKAQGRQEVLKADGSKTYKFLLTAVILTVFGLMQSGWVRYYFLAMAVINIILGLVTYLKWKKLKTVDPIS